VAEPKHPPLEIKLERDTAKYLEGMDQTTKKRIKEKLQELSLAPFNIRTSKPLKQSTKRSARVGAYRILFAVEGDILLVAAIGPRGQIYRSLN
jgi:mRNA interferase RelE/StbE